MYAANTLSPFNSDTKNFAAAQQSRKRVPPPHQPRSIEPVSRSPPPKGELPWIQPERLSIRVSEDVFIDKGAMTCAKNIEPSAGLRDATATNIQSVWSLFSRLNDHERNDLLKGLLATCDASQIECICQELNLKLSSTNGVGALHLHPLTSHARMNRTAFNRSQHPISVLKQPLEDLSSKLECTRLHETAVPRTASLQSPDAPSTSPPHSAKRASALSIPNANMYLKLFPQAELQAKTGACDKTTLLRLHEFAMQRCEKLEKTIAAINAAASSIHLEEGVLHLMQRLQKILHADHYTLYLFSEPPQPSTVRVACSNWIAQGHVVPSTTCLFGYPLLAGGECVNVYHANSSEHFLNTCHEFYPDATTCFLSAPILSEAGLLLAVIEFMNKHPAPGSQLAPFFDVEDEFVLTSTLPTWRLLLREAKAEQGIRDQSALLREILQWLEQMLLKKTRGEVEALIEKCMTRFVSAENATLNLDLNEALLPLEIKEKLSRGESILIAHALSLPEFKSLGIRNLVAVPLRLSNSTEGVIYAKNKIPSNEHFTPEDVLNMNTIISLFSSILNSAVGYQQFVKKIGDLEQNVHYYQTTFASQEQLLISISQNLDVIRADLGGTLLKNVNSSSGIYLPKLLDRKNEVLYYDLEQCVEKQEARCNSEYPLQLHEGQVQWVDYTLSPAQDHVILHLRPLSSALRRARFRSVFYPETLSLSSLVYPATSTSCTVTLMLLNIDSFRKWIQGLQESLLTLFLESYYAGVQTVVHQHGGVIPYLLSDRIICAFGLPTPAEDDAERAIQSANTLLKVLNDFFKEFQVTHQLEGPILTVRIALTTGPVSTSLCEFGNRTHFALIGEPMNLLPNLESVACVYGSPLILHKSTEQAAKKKFEFREIDQVVLPHTQEPSYVYDVVGLINAIADNDIRTCVICYELGLGEYRQHNFDAALTYFRKCKSLLDDGPSTLMIKRCQKACDNIQLVPSDWNGVWRWD